MTEAIGIRLDDETLTKVDSISKEEDEDRSTVIRKLITRGYKEIVKEKASEDYRAGESHSAKPPTEQASQYGTWRATLCNADSNHNTQSKT